MWENKFFGKIIFHEEFWFDLREGFDSPPVEDTYSGAQIFLAKPFLLQHNLQAEAGMKAGLNKRPL